MSDKIPTPADGNDVRKAAPDGVAGAPGRGIGEGVGGRTDSGETGGGAYPNPHSDQREADELEHGGQTEMKYYGAGQAGGEGRSASNAVAGSNEADADQASKLPPPEPERQPHVVQSNGRSFAVVEASGVAAAEAAGSIKCEADELPEDDSKLAG